MQNKPKFSPGELLQSSIHKGYHVFVQSVNQTHYHIFHTYVLENDKYINYAKNAGHDCLIKIEEFEKGLYSYGVFVKVGKIPALIGNKMVKINK